MASDAQRERALLDAKGASELLNVPASWVAAEARAGRIPHVRLGRYVRFEPEALRDWCRERQRGPWRGGRPAP
jgi:excisionase family DNA binding protein